MVTRHFAGDRVLHVLTGTKCVVLQAHGNLQDPALQDYTIKAKGQRPFRACGMELARLGDTY